MEEIILHLSSNQKGIYTMVKVSLVKHPLDFKKREKLLQDKLNELIKSGDTILFVTSDKQGYTIVHNRRLIM